jgi:membrane-associated protease RseP (regulator of RpoE activity)
VLVRLTRISGIDLRLFDFDHDLNFYVFFLGPDEHVYGRYGGRDGKSAEGRLSMAGLRHAMKQALAAHALKRIPLRERKGKPVLAEEFPEAKRLKPGTCIHCHQINEFRRAELKKAGRWSRDLVWRYPFPENVGLTLSVDQGDLVRAVARGSAAEKAGLQPGDVLKTVHATPVSSLADVQFALDRAPASGKVRITWQRGETKHEAALTLPGGWKRTNITWRPSLLDILITVPLYGEDLSAKEKKALGLSEKRLAFRQDVPISMALRKIGLTGKDVIIGVDDLTPDMTVTQFLAYLRRNYLAGDRVTLKVLREGKRVDLPLTFR